MDRNNVINLRTRKPVNQSKGLDKPSAKPSQPAQVVDITERRQEVIRQERRKVKRTILTEFIGAFVVVPQKGLLKVAIYDISENGVAFDIEPNTGSFHLGEEVAMRVYLNHQTYFPFTIHVQNNRLIDDEGVVRIGAGFVRETINEKALYHFVKFIEEVSAALEHDNGDIMVSNIKR